MKKLSLLLFTLLIVILPGKAFAAGITFKLEKSSLEVGQQQELKVIFDRQNTEVNGLEGRILLPIALLSDVKIKDGDSAVSLWVQKPEIAVQNGAAAVNFSAISPAGINGYLFSILFTGQTLGKGDFEFQGNMLLADGQGTRQGLNNESLPITFVASTAPLNQAPTPEDFSQDKTAPEDFSIYVTHDSKILNNQWFAAYNAQDTGSGIAFYEVLETASKDNPEKQSGWQQAQSPYVLKNQLLPNYLFVKAVDKNGNYRVATWENPKAQTKPNGQNGKIYVIITIIILLLLAVTFELYLKRHKKKNNNF